MHTVRLKNRREVAAGTAAFYLEKPARFSFQAGQFLEITLPDPPETDAEGNTRAFSIASAPVELDLMIATRLRDTAFKRVLKTLPVGAAVTIDGPFVNLVLPAGGSHNVVFLAGGIGITPFRSMIVDSAGGVQRRLFLFYANRGRADAAFLAELEALQNLNYTLISVMTKKSGRITRQMLADRLGELSDPLYYTAGPPGMVTAMRAMLREAGVADQNVRWEEFAGY